MGCESLQYSMMLLKLAQYYSTLPLVWDVLLPAAYSRASQR